MYAFRLILIVCWNVVIFSASPVPSEHGNHNITPKQEKMTTSVKVLVILSSCWPHKLTWFVDTFSSSFLIKFTELLSPHLSWIRSHICGILQWSFTNRISFIDLNFWNECQTCERLQSERNHKTWTCYQNRANEHFSKIVQPQHICFEIDGLNCRSDFTTKI